MKILITLFLLTVTASCATRKVQYRVTPYGVIENGKVKSNAPTKDILSTGDTLYSSSTQLFIIKKGGKDTAYITPKP